MRAPLILLGCGYTLSRLAEASADSREVCAVTGDLARRARLLQRGVQLLSLEEAIERCGGADVVHSIPPQGELDRQLARTFEQIRPRRLVYLSSTGVYGARTGEVDEETPVDPASASAAGRLAAEALFRPLGAVALRVAGIYGPGRGLHLRLAEGRHQLPEGGSRRLSRIHVDDLAAAVASGLERAEPGQTLCVADDAPVPQREVVAWLCERLGLALPRSVPLAEVPETLRADRAVQNRRLRSLGWTPRFPSYREGFLPLLEEARQLMAGAPSRA